MIMKTQTKQSSQEYLGIDFDCFLGIHDNLKQTYRKKLFDTYNHCLRQYKVGTNTYK